MKSNIVKYTVSLLLFINICSVAIVGFILGFILPYGRGSSPEAKLFLGLHRHEWTDIHLFLAISFLVLILIHLWIHWKWITELTRRYFGRHWKKFLYSISMAWLVVILICWIVVKF